MLQDPIYAGLICVRLINVTYRLPVYVYPALYMYVYIYLITYAQFEFAHLHKLLQLIELFSPNKRAV